MFQSQTLFAVVLRVLSPETDWDVTDIALTLPNHAALNEILLCILQSNMGVTVG